MTRRHVTLENLTERAYNKASERNCYVGVAKQGNWLVEYHGIDNIFRYYHYCTLVLTIEKNKNDMTYFYGESKSDADALNAMCDHHDLKNRFTYRPVNGGFMQIA